MIKIINVKYMVVVLLVMVVSNNFFYGRKIEQPKNIDNRTFVTI